MSKPYGMVAAMGIGDFVFSTVFISMLFAKHPKAVLDVGVKGEMIDALKKWGIFRNVLDFEEVWCRNRGGEYKKVFSGRHCHPMFIGYENSWLVPNRHDGGIPLKSVFRSNVEFLVEKGFSKEAGKMMWVVDGKSKKRARSKIEGCVHPVIGIHNSKGTEFWFRRKWRNHSFEKLIAAVPGTWLQFGSRNRDWDGDSLAGARRISTGGDLQLLSAFIQECDAIVSADTGVAAIAQALKVPTVLLMGPTDVLAAVNARVVKRKVCKFQPCLYHWGDGEAEEKMLKCHGSHTPCMDKIKVGDVLRPLSEALKC